MKTIEDPLEELKLNLTQEAITAAKQTFETVLDKNDEFIRSKTDRPLAAANLANIKMGIWGQIGVGIKIDAKKSENAELVEVMKMLTESADNIIENILHVAGIPTDDFDLFTLIQTGFEKYQNDTFWANLDQNKIPDNIAGARIDLSGDKKAQVRALMCRALNLFANELFPALLNSSAAHDVDVSRKVVLETAAVVHAQTDLAVHPLVVPHITIAQAPLMVDLSGVGDTVVAEPKTVVGGLNPFGGEQGVVSPTVQESPHVISPKKEAVVQVNLTVDQKNEKTKAGVDKWFKKMTKPLLGPALAIGLPAMAIGAGVHVAHGKDRVAFEAQILSLGEGMFSRPEYDPVTNAATALQQRAEDKVVVGSFNVVPTTLELDRGLYSVDLSLWNKNEPLVERKKIPAGKKLNLAWMDFSTMDPLSKLKVGLVEGENAFLIKTDDSLQTSPEHRDYIYEMVTINGQSVTVSPMVVQKDGDTFIGAKRLEHADVTYPLTSAKGQNIVKMYKNLKSAAKQYQGMASSKTNDDRPKLKESQLEKTMFSSLMYFDLDLISSDEHKQMGFYGVIVAKDTIAFAATRLEPYDQSTYLSFGKLHGFNAFNAQGGRVPMKLPNFKKNFDSEHSVGVLVFNGSPFSPSQVVPVREGIITSEAPLYALQPTYATVRNAQGYDVDIEKSWLTQDTHADDMQERFLRLGFNNPVVTMPVFNQKGEVTSFIGKNNSSGNFGRPIDAPLIRKLHDSAK